jgi:hypothetical protein
VLVSGLAVRKGPGDPLRPYADRLARLLADARGAEILAELQSLLVRVRDRREVPVSGSADGLDVGVWRAERADGGVALRRTQQPEACHWADVEYVPPPPAGARRVVVIGESVARGYGYERLFTPTGALAGQLDRVAPGRYQCVDLARTGASAADLTRLVGQLAVVEPDVVVVIAGNNWAQPNVTDDDGIAADDGLSGAMAGAMAGALRAGGPAAMRRVYIEGAALPRARRFLAAVLGLHARGAQVVVVVPESNLRGWVPPVELEVPVLAAGPMARWYELRAQAERAGAAADWARVQDAAGQMSALDGGTSPVPGQLLARAAVAVGDGAAARAGLEAANDALIGLGLPRPIPRMIREVADLLTGFAAEHRFPCVDLRAVLASPDIPGLPDQRLFHDYCHLTDEGMELMVSAVADAILGYPPGTTPPGPGIAPELRSFVHVTAAAQSAYFGQPVEAVDRYLRAAVAADPEVTDFLAALLEVIEGADPRWTHSAIELLATVRPVAEAFAPVLLARDVANTLWALRAALWDVLDTAPACPGTDIDLLSGRPWPEPPLSRAYRRSTTERQPLGFALHQPQAGVLALTYRMPETPTGTPAQVSPAAQVTLNDQPLGTLTASATWAQAHLTLPAHLTRTGMNWLRITWPVPTIDTGPRYAAAAAVLDRGTFPDLLPVFGELYEARLTLPPTTP